MQSKEWIVFYGMEKANRRYGEMKIVAGMGNVDDYEILAKAGADEIFCGFVPFTWNEKYHNLLPLNRREVLFYHVQAGTLEDMKILANKVKAIGVPVTIAFNALYYTSEQIDEIMQYIKQLVCIGFDSYIIADCNLIMQINKQNIPCKIHFSGELGEWNSKTIALFHNEFQIERIIFHRKNRIEDMKTCIATAKNVSFANSFEAFFLNEMCHFTGGFCNSLHCDELVHLCQLPYKVLPEDIVFEDCMEEEGEIGTTGCGLCALWKLKEAGITHLKVVGRGKNAEEMATDIQAVVQAREILLHSCHEEMYCKEMKENIFHDQCPKKCYY